MGKLRGPPLLAGGRLKKVRIAEVAGGTTADCAAVCCCIPCCLVNVLFHALYRVPAGLCRNALRRRRRSGLKKKGASLPELPIDYSATAAVAPTESDKDAIELEKEMWEKFYGGGFWRSLSQRSGSTQLSKFDQLVSKQ